MKDKLLKYKIYGNSKAFKSKLEKVRKFGQEVINKHDNIGISVSGGKDSSCMLDLILSIRKDAKVFFIETGADYPDTYKNLKDLEKKYNIKIIKIKSRKTYQEMKLHDLENPDKEYEREYMQIMVNEPVEKMIKDYKLDLQCIGLRSQESKGRDNLFRYHGDYFFTKKTQCHSFYPLSEFSDLDVFTYLVTNNVPINDLYFKQSELFGGEPEKYRVGTYLTYLAVENGSLVVLKNYFPELYEEQKKILNWINID